ncbi:hypothetical protein J6590_026723 [Homalodisca vitripennis]|nr:hypothetical protein J6590_026723 [Homalodisca vitripennis]
MTIAGDHGHGHGMFCYHCPPSLHPSSAPRLPSLDYPFSSSHPCEYTLNVTEPIELKHCFYLAVCPIGGIHCKVFKTIGEAKRRKTALQK